MLMATAKQVTTMLTHRALPRPDFDEDMWLSPWIVEFSKNSERIAKTILSNWNGVTWISIQTFQVLLRFGTGHAFKHYFHLVRDVRYVFFVCDH